MSVDFLSVHKNRIIPVVQTTKKSGRSIKLECYGGPVINFTKNLITKVYLMYTGAAVV